MSENNQDNYVKIYNELQEARGVIARQQQDIENIEKSTCWRITKPIRVVGIAAKRSAKKCNSLFYRCIN